MKRKLNPPVIIEKVKIPEKNISVKVVRDDHLIGGTKQRALEIFIEKGKNEYVYAGPSQGYAQIALANVAKVYHKRATVFIPREKTTSSQTKRAIELGAKIIKLPMGLKDLQKAAEKYTSKRNDRLLIPFGLNREDFVYTLASQIKESWGRKHKPKRLWVVAGSSAIVNALNIAFPDCYFFIVQVGKTIWPDMIENIKYDFFKAPERFTESAKKPPPYESVLKYDAKLWQFVLDGAKEGDYVWNVGRD